MSKPLTINGVNLIWGGRDIIDTKVGASAYITDSRVIVCCKSWNESHFVALSIAKMVGNRNAVFGGHVRYEWVTAIGYSMERSGANVSISWVTEEGKRHSTELRPVRTMATTFGASVLNTGASTLEVAHEILRRLCMYRLSLHDEKTPDELEFFQQHSRTPLISTRSGSEKAGKIDIPHSYPAPGGRGLRG